ncbi:MAG: F0F1 ATP synthase subunit A [Candidatus Dojkabacteria bacterium]|nr:F0F1 ATP synthase subunit A [Candidatus Dojkabacteria bacterium]
MDLIAKIVGDKEVGRKIMPAISAVFVYILIDNVLGILIPFLGAVTYDGSSIFVTSTSDLNTTFGIASTVVLWTHYESIKKNNPIKHILKFIKLDSVANGIKKGPGGVGLALIDVFIGILDIVSEFAKSLSLSLRLFANMFAGEVLMTLLLSSLALVLPISLMFMGIFTGTLQALVFAALSASYFGAALKDD